jgi:hypothetical protein
MKSSLLRKRWNVENCCREDKNNGYQKNAISILQNLSSEKAITALDEVAQTWNRRAIRSRA